MKSLTFFGKRLNSNKLNQALPFSFKGLAREDILRKCSGIDLILLDSLKSHARDAMARVSDLFAGRLKCLATVCFAPFFVPVTTAFASAPPSLTRSAR